MLCAYDSAQKATVAMFLPNFGVCHLWKRIEKGCYFSARWTSFLLALDNLHHEFSHSSATQAVTRSYEGNAVYRYLSILIVTRYMKLWTRADWLE